MGEMMVQVNNKISKTILTSFVSHYVSLSTISNVIRLMRVPKYTSNSLIISSF